MNSFSGNNYCHISLCIKSMGFRMRAALNKARQSYQLKYQEFILKIERDADEVMFGIVPFPEI